MIFELNWKDKSELARQEVKGMVEEPACAEALRQ